jgi:hypothetical protein
MLFASGFVWVQKTEVVTTRKGEEKERKRNFIAQPGDKRLGWVAPGRGVYIVAEQKASSPYYTWVRALTGERPKEDQYTKCLTEPEQLAVQRLQDMATALRGLRNRFGALRNKLYRIRNYDPRLDEAPPTWDVKEDLRALGKALARVASEREQIAYELGPDYPAGVVNYKAAEIVIQQLSYQPNLNAAIEERVGELMDEAGTAMIEGVAAKLAVELLNERDPEKTAVLAARIDNLNPGLGAQLRAIREKERSHEAIKFKREANRQFKRALSLYTQAKSVIEGAPYSKKYLSGDFAGLNKPSSPKGAPALLDQAIAKADLLARGHDDQFFFANPGYWLEDIQRRVERALTLTFSAPPPLAMFRLTEDTWEMEPDSPLTHMLDRALELQIVEEGEEDDLGRVKMASGVNYRAADSKQARAAIARQRAVLKMIARSTEANKDLGLSGIHFLMGKGSEEEHTAMSYAMKQAGFSDDAVRPGVHPMDDFYRWLLSVTDNFDQYPDQGARLQQMRSGANLISLAASGVEYGSAPSVPKARKDPAERAKVYAWEWGHHLRPLVIGGQLQARPRRTEEKLPVDVFYVAADPTESEPHIRRGRLLTSDQIRKVLGDVGGNLEQAALVLGLPPLTPPTASLKQAKEDNAKRQELLAKLFQKMDEDEKGGRVGPYEVPDAPVLSAYQFDENGPRIEPISGKPMAMHPFTRPGISFEEQLDRNDALSLLLVDAMDFRRFGAWGWEDTTPTGERVEQMKGSVFSEPKYQKKGEGGWNRIDNGLLEMLLYTLLYYDLGGFDMDGGLGLTQHDAAIDEVAEIENRVTQILGGRAIGTSSSEGFTTYKTYNPVLFEMTRLYWTSRDAKVDPRWKGFLSNADALRDLDAVGRYGTAASLLQRVVLYTHYKGPGRETVSNQWREEELREELKQSTYAPIRTYVNATEGLRRPPLTLPTLLNADMSRLDDRTVNYLAEEYSLEPFTVRDAISRAMRNFDLLWPLGATTIEAEDELVALAEDPIAGLRQMKLRAAKAVPRLLAMREAGLPPKRRTEEQLERDEEGDVVALVEPSATTILTEPYIQEIMRGSVPALEPEIGMEGGPGVHRSLKRLRSALQKAVGADYQLYPGVRDEDLGDLAPLRARNEREALAEFQRSPGHVRRRVEGRLQRVTLEPTARVGLTKKGVQDLSSSRGVMGVLLRLVEEQQPPAVALTAALNRYVEDQVRLNLAEAWDLLDEEGNWDGLPPAFRSDRDRDRWNSLLTGNLQGARTRVAQAIKEAQEKGLVALRGTGVYDPATILQLAKVEASVQLPPGEREYAGQPGTPWLMRERVGPEYLKQVRRGVASELGAQPDIYQESVLRQIEDYRGGAAAWVRRIDGLIGELEAHLGIGPGPVPPTPSAPTPTAPRAPMTYKGRLPPKEEQESKSNPSNPWGVPDRLLSLHRYT